MENQFGERLRQLREANHLLQRQVASMLDMDTPMLSKIERGDRKAKREHILKLASIYKADSKELLTIWLADQLFDLVKNEEVGLRAIKMTEEKINRKMLQKND